MLQSAQSTPTAGMLQSRLQSKHLAHAEREALRNCDVCLSFACRAVACVQNRPQLVPPLGRRRLDDSRNRPIEQQRKEKRRRHRLVRHDALVRILEAVHQELLYEASRMRLDVGIDGR